MSEATRATEITAVALQILEQEGPEAVSMRRIAKAIGVTPMALYHHFSSREALLQSATDGEFDRLAAQIESITNRGSVETSLLKVMNCYLDYAFSRPRVFDYVFSQKRTGARRFPDDFRARRSPTLNRIADIVAAAMNCGELRKDDAWEVALEVWAHVHGYLTLFRAGRFTLEEEPFRQLCRRSLRRLLNGLKV